MRTWHILLVDDDKDDFRLTRSMLSQAQERQVSVEWAQTFQEGLDAVRREGAAYDAVLVDYDLGGSSGIEWIRQVSAAGCPWPIILYTSRASRAVDIEGMEAGASMYLSKLEATPLLLERTIRYAIERKQAERDLAEANRLLAIQNADLEKRVAERMVEVEQAAAALAERNDELAERENLLNQVLESLPVGVWLVDSDGRILSGNSEGKRIWGGAFYVGPDEFDLFKGARAGTGVPLQPEDWAAARVIRENSPVLDEEIDIETFDGQQRTIWSSSVPLRDSQGRLSGAVVVNRDITQARQTQEELSRAYALLDSVFQNIYLAKALLDSEFNFVRVNETYAALDGRPVSFFPGKNHFSLYPDLENEAVFRQVLETGRPYLARSRPFTYPHKPERGVTYWDWSLQPVMDDQNRPTHLLLTLLDVTERRLAEEKLEERVRERTAEAERHAASAERAANQLETVVESIADAVLVIREGRFVHTNAQARRLIGRSIGDRPLSEVLGEFQFETADGRAVPPDQMPSALAMRGQVVRNVFLKFTRWDGQRLNIMVSASPLQEGGQVNGAVVVFREVSESEAQASFRAALLDNINDAILTIGVDQPKVITSWNPGAERVFGYRAAEALGKGAGKLLAAGLSKEQRDCIVRELEQNGTYQGRHSAARRDGGRIMLDVSLSVLRGLRGEVAGLLFVGRDISDQINQEQAQREQEARLRESLRLYQYAFDHSPAAQLVCDSSDWRVLAANQRSLHLTGRGAGEMAALSIPDLIYEDDRGAACELLNRYASQGPDGEAALAGPLQLRLANQQREPAWVEMYLGPTRLCDKSGRRCVTAVLVETGRQGLPLEDRLQLEDELTRISEEQARMEASLQESAVEIARRELSLGESEARLRANETRLWFVLEHLPIGVWIINEKGEIVYGNPAGQKVWDGAEYVGQDEYKRYRAWWYDTGQELAAEDWAGLRAVNYGETSLDEILKIKSFEGSEKIIRNSAVPLRDDKGQVLGAVVVNEDITEMVSIQRELEENRDHLRESELYYRMIFQLSVVGQATVDPFSLRIRAANQRLADITGYSPDELGNLSLMDLTSPEEREQELESFGRVLLGEEREYASRKKFIRKDGSTRWVEVHTGLIRDVRGMPERAVLAVLDINDQIKAMEVTRSYLEQLARSNEELEQFAFVASHDLQEPVRKIEGFAALLKARSDSLSETDREYVERVQNAATRMRRMIDDLLALSRVSTRGKAYEWVDLTEVAQSVVADDLEQRIWQTGGQVVVGNLPRLEADPLQVRQLLQNLMNNGLKFHKDGVAPVVRVSGERTADGRVKIRVEDNGIGIDMKNLDRIFRPFVRLHERWRYEGTGMGLAICKKIVDRHEGEIHAESVPGQGTVFTIILPERRREV